MNRVRRNVSIPGRVEDLESRVKRLSSTSTDTSGFVSTGDSRLSDARTPTAHASSHQHNGSDEVATATPGNNAIPKANGSGKLAAGWGGAANTIATLNASSKVVEDPASATATPGASKIPIADGSGKLAAGWGGSASTLATLNASTKVVEDPANATATPAASKIVIADSSGLVDGWVSDAGANTKGKIQLANCLGGNAASPTVVAVKETGANTVLTFGTVTDGEFLKRSGSTVISAAPSSLTEADVRLGKTFFTTHSLMPATTYTEQLYTMPAPDFSNLNSGTLNRTLGQIEYITSSTNVHNFGWDTGAARTKLLFIMCGIKTRANGCQMFFCDSAPGVGEPPNTLYMFNLDISGAQLQVQKRTGGAYTTLATYNKFLINDAYASAGVDMAFYYNDTTGDLKCFLRYGMASWTMPITLTDSSFTTMRYVGFRIASTGGLTTWMTCPMAVYYTT